MVAPYALGTLCLIFLEMVLVSVPCPRVIINIDSFYYLKYPFQEIIIYGHPIALLQRWAIFHCFVTGKC